MEGRPTSVSHTCFSVPTLYRSKMPASLTQESRMYVIAYVYVILKENMARRSSVNDDAGFKWDSFSQLAGYCYRRRLSSGSVG